VLDSLILAAALLASQGSYGVPAAPPPQSRAGQPAAAAPAPTPQPSVPAVPGRMLGDLPNTTITYFDVTGRNFKAINKSIEKHLKPAAGGQSAAGQTGWSINATFRKVTSAGQCKVAEAKANFSAKVVLPRLVPDRAHKPELLAAWRTYLADIENTQAADLWFIYDRIGNVEKAMLASSCDGVQSAGAAAINRIRAEAAEFRRSKSPAAPAAK
jgi:predicted secreted Zn-dependent protease